MSQGALLPGVPLLAGVLLGLAVAGWPARQEAVPSTEASPRRHRRARGREVLTTDDVASSMALLAVALSSGCGVVEAIEQVARQSPGSVGHQLGTVAAALRWGVDERAAWGAVDPAWRHAGQAMRLATRAGVPPSALLMQSAGDLRATELARLDVEAARVGVRMVLPLGLAFLPAFCLTSVIPIILALAQQVLGS
ncbi:MAG: type II secretion system F family protein [Actinomycetota bacterium]|nr:type II secretion system F family protein [Actinomycetota bacterium]